MSADTIVAKVILACLSADTVCVTIIPGVFAVIPAFMSADIVVFTMTLTS